MNILIIEDIASSEYGGAERSMRWHCEYWNSMGFSVHLVYSRPGNYLNSEFNQIYSSINKVNTLPVKAQSIISFIANIFKLIRIIKKNNIGIVFTHVIHCFPIIRIVKIFVKVKFIVFFKTTYSKNNIGFQAKWGMKAIDKYAAINESVRQYWITNGLIKENLIIPDGIWPYKGSVELIDENNEIPLLLFAGRIYEGKGLHILLKSIKLLISKGINVKLLICGKLNLFNDQQDSNYHNYLISFINNNNLNNNVELLGYINDLKEIIKKSNLVVVPSTLADSQPLIILESMLLGKLVIGSNVGGIPEILSDNLSVLVFKSNDELDLSIKIEEILILGTNNKYQLKEKLYNRFLNYYDIKYTFSELTSLLT